MAFTSGINVTCGLIGIKAGTSLMAVPTASQPLATAGATTFPNGAREPSIRTSQSYDALMLGFEIQAAVDVWVSYGPTPTASASGGSGIGNACILVRSGETRNVFCNAGDQVAFTPA